MLDGKRPVECNKCWFLENRGLLSDRQLKNQMLDYYMDRDIRYIEEDCRQGNYETRVYKIDTSFNCNGACVTCGPTHSSLWAKLTNQNHLKSMNLEDVDELVNYSTAIDINFRGGEPLLSRTNFQILERLLENNNNTCLITFTTNGSVKLTEKQIDILSQFENIGFNLSIDATEKAFEYIRYPLSWQRLNQNLVDYREITKNISVSCTISNISVMYYDALVNWFNKNQLPYNYNPVHRPTYFRPSALSQKVKNHILENTNSNVVEDLLENHTTDDDIEFDQCKKQIAQQDHIKGIHVKNYLPELHSVFGFDH